MNRPRLQVRTELYTDSNARNWLAIRECLVSPTALGTLEVVFRSQRDLVEFSLLYSHYANGILSNTQ